MSAALDIIRDPQAAGSVLHPIRRQVLRVLRDEGSATSVGTELQIPRQKVNYHLRALEQAGLVEHVADRRKGNCTERVMRATAAHYLIDPAVLGDLDPTPEGVADRVSSDHLAAVSARTVTELAELRDRADSKGKRLATFSLETGVRFESPAAQAAFAEDLSAAVAGVVRRYHTDAADGRWFRVAVGAHPALTVPNRPEDDEAGDATTSHPDSQRLTSGTRP